ncbi:MAG: DNA-processing protein DprA [Candidatus Caenarcaniphilales bacterium]|nr:DNA-processing protein DprA [Candidatus Caenarcaniphilales bacterium]
MNNNFDEKAYWLAFDNLQGIGLGTRRIQLLYKHFASLKLAWEADRIDLLEVKNIPEFVIDRFIKERQFVSLEEVFNKLKRTKIKAICQIDLSYPSQLLQLKQPPLVLYYRGHWQEDYLTKSIGIVGTRHPSNYAQEKIQQLSYELSLSGYTIVSGMAMGIDSWAHRGSLKVQNNKQIAVLANGVDQIVPSSSRDIYERLIEEGVVISEYPPETQPEKGYFPARNRIIAAFSQAILIGEAGKNSGSLITAERAIELKKPIFGLVGIPNEQTEGIFKWIRKGMAKLVTGTGDILEELKEPILDTDSNMLKQLSEERYQQKALPINKLTQERKSEKKCENETKDLNTEDLSSKLDELTVKEKEIFHKIPFNQFISIDKLIEETQTPIAKLNSAIMKLQMKKLIKRDMSGSISQNHS